MVPSARAREQAFGDHLTPGLRSLALTNSGCGFKSAHWPVDRLRIGNELKEQLELRGASGASFGYWLGCWKTDCSPVVRISQFEMDVASIVHEIHFGFDEGLRSLTRDVTRKKDDTLCPIRPQVV